MITSISPVDGRYEDSTSAMCGFSEFNIMRGRVQVEAEWLRLLLRTIPRMPAVDERVLFALYNVFSQNDAEAVKKLETATRHDIKAIEQWLRIQLAELGFTDLMEYVHFGLTSEDVSNVAYGLAINNGRQVLLAAQLELIRTFKKLAVDFAGTPMLARTHGQPASPTTFGKEMAVFAARLWKARRRIQSVPIYAKFSGATGNFSALAMAYPGIDWIRVTSYFLMGMGLSPNLAATQIEPHDGLAELFDAIARFNTILIDACRDMWQYMSFGYVVRNRPCSTEISSSAMPHKNNPVDFENAEGNAGIANALLRHLSQTLPISRLQRDLSDSTAMRNVGVAMAHSLLTVTAAQRGMCMAVPDAGAMLQDLQSHKEVLSEAVQTLLRKTGYLDSFGAVLRGIRSGDQVELPAAVASEIQELSVEAYIGKAPWLAVHLVGDIP